MLKLHSCNVPKPRSKLHNVIPISYVCFANSYLGEIMSNVNLVQQGNFIDVVLARHVSGIYAHHQEH